MPRVGRHARRGSGGDNMMQQVVATPRAPTINNGTEEATVGREEEEKKRGGRRRRVVLPQPAARTHGEQGGRWHKDQESVADRLPSLTINAGRQLL